MISPKNSVLPVIGDHFADRFSGEKFLIFDRVHSLALVHDQTRTALGADGRGFDLSAPSEREQNFRALWRRFYETIAIEGRRNEKCRMSHMPKRYWNNMTEFQPGDAESAKERICRYFCNPDQTAYKSKRTRPPWHKPNVKAAREKERAENGSSPFDETRWELLPAVQRPEIGAGAVVGAFQIAGAETRSTCWGGISGSRARCACTPGMRSMAHSDSMSAPMWP